MLSGVQFFPADRNQSRAWQGGAAVGLGISSGRVERGQTRTQIGDGEANQ